MKPEVLRSTSGPFDLLIIGGGVYGLCTAWDATLRGLSVALVEKDDFTHACTAVNYKLLHGGLRYLQHLDFKRMRVSICERRAMSRMAPHLVTPVSFVIPCKGHGMQGPEVMAAALAFNDLVGFDRNKGVLPSAQVPRGRILSKQECLKRVPGLSEEGLTGGGLYTDLQMRSAERLALSMGISAAEKGAVLANYTEVSGLRKEQNRIVAAEVLDKRSGESFEVKADFFINMTGPWSEITKSFSGETPSEKYVVRSKGVQLFTRKLADVGFSIQTNQQDTTARISRGGRSLFVQPWHNTSFIGQTDKLFKGDPDDFRITRQDVEEFLEEINQAFPAAKLTMDDVVHVLGGMIPVSNDDPNAGETNVTHKYEVHDHAESDGTENYISVNGVKYTIARYLAEQAVSMMARKTGKRLPSCSTAEVVLAGGDLTDVQAEIQKLMTETGQPERVATHLVHMYGTKGREVLAAAESDSDFAACIPGSDQVTGAEVLHAVREEWAEHLTDVVLRRTDLGTLGAPAEETVQAAAALMADELGWTAERTQKEVQALRDHYVLG